MIEQQNPTSHKLHKNIEPELIELKTPALDGYKEGMAGYWTSPQTKILQTSYLIDNIELSTPRQSASTILPATNHPATSFVLNGQYNYKEVIAHISVSGEILQILDHDIQDYCFEMLADGLVLVVNCSRQSKQLIQWNLRNYKKIVINVHKIIRCQAVGHQISAGNPTVISFSESQMFCFCCQSQWKSERSIKLVYYQFPLESKEDKPCYETYIYLPPALHKLKFVKLNQHSMVGWLPVEYCRSQQILITTHKILQNKSHSKIYNFHVQLKQPSSSIMIADMWEVNHQVIYLQFSTLNKSVNVFRDVIWHEKQKKYRKTNFDTQREHRVQFLGSFRNFMGFCDFPVYYVDMMTEQIMAVEIPQKKQTQGSITVTKVHLASGSQFQYSFTSYPKKTRNGPQEIQVQVRKIKCPRINIGLVVAFLLESMITNCDEDLISYTLVLIDPIEKSPSQQYSDH